VSVTTKRNPKSRKYNRKQPILTWLKGLVSRYDHCPGEYNPEAGKITPVKGTRITNKQMMALINRSDGVWWTALNNELILRHVTGQQVRYGSGNERLDKDTLANLDIDCHDAGTPEEAHEFIKYAADVLGKGSIFAEPSTNKTGAHGYVVIDRYDPETCKGESAGAVNDGLFSLELFLNRLLRNGRPDGQPWNITGVEIKGNCAKARWDDQGRCVGYTAGSLMKLPQTFMDSPEREQELRNTARFSLTELGALHRKKVPNYLASPTTKVGSRITDPRLGVTSKTGGSTKSHPIKRREIERIGSEYANLAHRLFPNVLLTKSRHVATREDQAIYLCILAFCTDTQPDDKAMPSRRIYSTWKAMKTAQDVSRAPDHGRIAAMRNHLSKTGNIDWYDNQFWTPDKPEFRPDRVQKGVCCKYSLKKQLMLELGFTASGVQRETIASTRTHLSQYHTSLALYYSENETTSDYIRPQRVGWASEYWGVAA
jgi:hypothetical protein